MQKWGIQVDSTDKPVNEQSNKRVGLRNFQTYEEAAAFKKELLETGDYSKVKVIRRPKGNFNVACYVPLGKEG